MLKLSRRIHATLDHVTSSAVSILPTALNLDDDDPVHRLLRRHGTISGSYSAVTDYEHGMLRILPYRLHLLLDAASIVVLVVGALATADQRTRYRWLPFLLAGAEAAIVVLSLPGLKEAEATAVG